MATSSSSAPKHGWPAIIEATGSFIQKTGFPIALVVALLSWGLYFLTPRVDKFFTQQGELMETADDSLKSQSETLSLQAQTLQAVVKMVENNSSLVAANGDAIEDVQHKVEEAVEEIGRARNDIAAWRNNRE